MKTITILSGKGGVGKSSLTASLAVLLARTHKIVTADCDVDAPNLALVLGVKGFDKSEKIQTSEKAKVIAESCPECKDKIDLCVFKAISWDEENERPVIDRILCEGCGTCLLAFPKGTVEMEKVENAEISTAKTSYGFPIVSGQLKIGESGSGKIVTALKNRAEELGREEDAELMLVDSAAGIGCPVIASIQGSDYVVAVTEPTPSALNDLQRALKVVEYFGIKYGIIINKWDINKRFTSKIERFADENDIKIVGKIPYDKSFVDALVNLKPIVLYSSKFENIFEDIAGNIKKALGHVQGE
jgi:MinD superfamily P-loop ATPase